MIRQDLTPMNNPNPVRLGRRVLVVDDNDELARSYKRLLELRGYEAAIFNDGAAALKHILHEDVDAVICDLGMPRLEGDTFYTTVERVDPRLASRFIFITGMASDPHYRPFFDRVACPVLEKPVESAKLLEVLEQLWTRVA